MRGRLGRRVGTVLFASVSRLAQAALLGLRGSSLRSVQLVDHAAISGDFATFTKASDYLHLLGAFLCMLSGATAAGLTLGLVSLEPLEIALKLRAGTEEEKRQAKRIYPLITRHHLLLVSLLLFNAAANEALPLFLEALVSPVLAIIFSITVVLVFGEILPSALMTGPKQLELASNGVGIAWVVIAVLSPVAYPISLLLDWIFGQEGVKVYTRGELAALLHVQREVAEKEGLGAITMSDNWMSPREEVEGRRAAMGLSHEETHIMDNILMSADRCAKDCCTPINKLVMLSLDDTFTSETLCLLSKSGYSRVPVYEFLPHNLRGYVHVKDLLVHDLYNSKVKVRDIAVKEPIVVGPQTGLLELLSLFQQSGNQHKVAFVSESPRITRACLVSGEVLSGQSAVVGVVTMDDVLHAVTCGLKEETPDADNHLRDRLVHSLSRSIVSVLKTMNTVFNDPAVRSGGGNLNYGGAISPEPGSGPHHPKLDPLAREIRKSLELKQDINLSALLRRHSSNVSVDSADDLQHKPLESSHSPGRRAGNGAGGGQEAETLEEKSEHREPAHAELQAAHLPQT